MESTDVDPDASNRPLGRRHSSAAIPSPPDEKGPKTATSYSFRERSPSSKSVASDKKANQKPLAVRFEVKADEREEEVKEFFLSVPMTARRASNVQWKEDFEMTVMGGESSPGWRRSAASLKSPQRQTPVQACSPSHQRSQSMRVGYGKQKEDERRRPTATLLQVPNPHRPRGTSLPSHRVLAEPSACPPSLYGNRGPPSAPGPRLRRTRASESDVPRLPTGAGDQRQDEDGDYYLIRQFIVHGKGNKVVNRGDSFRRLARNPSSAGSLSTSQLHLSLR